MLLHGRAADGPPLAQFSLIHEVRHGQIQTQTWLNQGFNQSTYHGPHLFVHALTEFLPPRKQVLALLGIHLTLVVGNSPTQNPGPPSIVSYRGK
jgi:hypothetical protein